MDLEHLLEAAEREEQRLLWEGSFAQYLRIVTETPSLARLSHARVYDMIMARGVESGSRGRPVYGLFKEDIFGMDEPLERFCVPLHIPRRRYAAPRDSSQRHAAGG